MVSKRTILRILINFIGAICLLLYIYVRLKEKPFNIIDKKYYTEEKKGIYGDLYNMILVDKFKLLIPEFYPLFKESQKNSKLEDADIIMFGDSFFEFGSHNKQIPERISDTLNKKVCFISSYNCLAELNMRGYKKGKRKTLIYEIAERRILKTFANKQLLYYKDIDTNDKIISSIFPYDVEERYNFLLQKSIITKPLYVALANFKFNYLNCISTMTPFYSNDPPWLFYYLDVNKENKSFYYNYKYSYEELVNVSNNINDFKIKLDELYNLELVFIPIPNKYTIYHRIINNNLYNNLLPNLYNELSNRDIAFIELLNDYLNSDKILYYQTDSHYNIEGENIVMKKLFELLTDIKK